MSYASVGKSAKQKGDKKEKHQEYKDDGTGGRRWALV